MQDDSVNTSTPAKAAVMKSVSVALHQVLLEKADV